MAPSRKVEYAATPREDFAMSNDFFNNHRMLGSVFDFDHDGSMSLGEAMTMGGIFGAYADEMERSSLKAERVSSPWDDDDDFDDEYDPYDD